VAYMSPEQVLGKPREGFRRGRLSVLVGQAEEFEAQTVGSSLAQLLTIRFAVGTSTDTSGTCLS